MKMSSSGGQEFAGHEHQRLIIALRCALAERVNNGQLLAGSLDLKNPVEACVAHNVYICDAYLSQQLLADGVLHKQTSKAFEHSGIVPAIELKEYLVGTEYA